MNYAIRLDQSRKLLEQMVREIDDFNRYARYVQQHTDFFKRSITNVQGVNNELENLKGESSRLSRMLDSLLKGGKKRYAPNREERASTHFQGEYGRLKGDIRKYKRSLSQLYDHLDFLSDVVKSTDSDESRITLALQSYASQNEAQLKKFGSSFDGSDPLIIIAAVAAIIKSVFKKMGA